MSSGGREKSDQIVCRCNDVSVFEIEEAIERGITDLELLRRYLHIGMGSCQGRNCIPLVQKILADKTGNSIKEMRTPTSRSPIVPVPIEFFQRGGGCDGC